MILHLLFDDKFSDYAIEQFERLAPGQNEYLVLQWDDVKECRQLKHRDKVSTIEENSKELNEFCHTLERFKAIITHNLSTPGQEKIINSAPDEVKIAWVFWGFEVYSRNDNYKLSLGPLTKRLANKYAYKAGIKNILQYLKTGKKNKKVFNVNIDAFKKVDYCLTDLREDHQFAKEYLKADFKHQWYNYYSIDHTLGDLKNERINGNNILIGNSATLSNNHLEVFDFLKKIHLEDRKLIVPLSYGDRKYARFIKNKGTRLFGDKFMPLTTFMDRTAYNCLIQSCSVAIMNHYRHQAMGNLITAIWLGAKVFMSERSTTFTYFRRLGLNISSIEEELNPLQKDVFAPLDIKCINHNRKILMEEYGLESMKIRIGKLIEILVN